MRASWLRSAEHAVLALMVAMAGVVGAGRAAAQDRTVPDAAVGGLAAVNCPSVAACLAVGGGTVVATTNSGAQWTVVSSPPNVFELIGVACQSATRCVVVGSGNGDAGAVYGTVDGGMTWRVQPAVLVGGLFLAISCASRVMCVVTGNAGAVFFTVDAGRTWHERTLTDASLINGIDCVTTSVCEAVGYSGRDGVTGVALRTTDGGRHWDTQLLPTSIPFPEAVACPSIDICVAVGQNTIHAGSEQVGVIAVTQDGGTTWRRQRAPDGYTNLGGVACPAIGICEAVGYGPHAILGTVDGGKTWTRQGPRDGVLEGISCRTRSTCVAVGQTNAGRGAVYRTTDGGQVWHRQPIG